jgi:serine/threonine protein kinase/tetratricopeptide (TPR) repeat protein
MDPERWKQVEALCQAALEREGSERVAFLLTVCGGDKSLLREVAALLAHETAAQKFMEAPAVQVMVRALAEAETEPLSRAEVHHTLIGKTISHYRILEKLGSGGMGTVYRAVRADDYEQQVAIKLLNRGLDTDFLLGRFRSERQILARFEHPNVARLLDGGSTEDGDPYFVMEYVQGGALDEYCDSHKLTVSERLRLFRTICSAVQYAHQNLIVHRDLKPSNILVTAGGVPKLLDFGIAKILNPDIAGLPASRTMTWVKLLTPEYASPEQLRGEAITTASDVYSLGVVLYELLTGRRPYHLAGRSPEEVARVVAAMEPERPSSAVIRAEELTSGRLLKLTPGAAHGAREGSPQELRRRLSGDLDNIVLMALRKEPQRRYASVEQFSEDIRRHLANLPVLARRGTIRYRTSKFIRRHKPGVAATATVILALLLGMAITAREARLAQRRFNDVRSLANSLMFDVHDSIRDLPGSTPARKVIVEKALEYLDALAQEVRTDAGLRRELAAGYKRIGDVQGYQFGANLGDTAGALKSYRKALAIRQALFASHPNNVGDAVALAESWRVLADTLLASSDTTGAMKSIQQATEISEQTERAHPNEVNVLQELRGDYEAQADILGGNFNLSNLGDTSAALAYRQKELKVVERIAAIEPNDPSIQRGAAVTTTKMGDQLLLSGETREALGYYLRAQKSFETLTAHSTSARVLDNLHSVYTRLQQTEMWSGDARQAVLINRKALELSKRSSLADPSNTFERLALAGDYGNLADSLSRTGIKPEAVSLITQALNIMAELVARSPKNTEYLGMQAAEYVTAGDVFRRFGDYPRALRLYRQATAINSQIQSGDPNNVDVRLRLAAVHNELGLTLVRLGDLKGATEAYNKALKIVHPQTTSGQPNEEGLYSTADAYAGLGDIEAALAIGSKEGHQQRRRHWEKACSWYSKSLGVWKQVREPGAVSPDGFEPVLPSVVRARLARCEQTLATPVSAQ